MDKNRTRATAFWRSLILGVIITFSVVGLLSSITAAINAFTPYRIVALTNSSLSSEYGPGALLIAQNSVEELQYGQVVVLPDQSSVTVGRVTDFLERDGNSYTLTVRADNASEPASYLYRSSDSIYGVIASVPFAGYVLGAGASVAGAVLIGVLVGFLSLIYLFVLHRIKTREDRSIVKIRRLRKRAQARINDAREDGIADLQHIFQESQA